MSANFEQYTKSFPTILMEIEGRIGRYYDRREWNEKKTGVPHGMKTSRIEGMRLLPE